MLSAASCGWRADFEQHQCVCTCEEQLMTRYLHPVPEPAIRVRCLRCRHETQLPESALRRFHVQPGAPIASYVKRLRCRKCGCQSVEASHVETKPPILISRTSIVPMAAS